MKRPILKRSDNIVDTKLSLVEGLSQQEQIRKITAPSDVAFSHQYYGTTTSMSATTFVSPTITSIKDETTPLQIKSAENVTTIASIVNPSLQKIVTSQEMVQSRSNDNIDSSLSKFNEITIDRDNSKIENLESSQANRAGSSIESIRLESNLDNVNTPDPVDIMPIINNEIGKENIYQEDNEDQQAEEDEEILSWEEQKRRKDEEKQRLQQEAWEKEQRELELLQQQEEEDERRARESKANEAIEKEKDLLEGDQRLSQDHEIPVGQDQSLKEDPIMSGVDPVMLHYMELVKKRKEESKVVYDDSYHLHVGLLKFF